MKRVYLLGVGLSSLLAAACSPSSNSDLGSGGSTGSKTDAAATTSGSSQGGNGSGPSATGSTAAFMPVAGSTGSGSPCVSGPNEDQDHDGWTTAQGDCNDCDPNVNPGAIEVIVTTVDPMTNMVPPPVDEDCDGTIDNVPQPCDSGLAVDSASAADAAKAIELCKTAVGAKDYGVISADYVNANGTGFTNNAAQHGILANFGPQVAPKGGASILALSSGRARLPGQANACTSESCCENTNCTHSPDAAPANFPQAVPGCNGGTTIFDSVGLQVQLRAPSNATGYNFAFKFHSWEFPEWVCTTFNDQFIALVDPPPMGANNGNISFDSNNNPVSVNIAFFNVCAPALCGNLGQHCDTMTSTCPSPASCTCPDGPGQLTGTGFDNSAVGDAGGTVWLQTSAPIKGSDVFTIRFAIWDTGDEHLDSTTLVDNFQWIAQGGTAVVVGTTPVPN